MLEFTCSTCSKRVQADDAFAGKHVLCPACGTAMIAPKRAHSADSPAAAIVAPEHAALAKIAMPTSSSTGSFREGQPPYAQEPVPPIRKEAPRIVMRYLRVLVMILLGLIPVGLLVQFFLQVRATAARTQSTNNLKMIVQAFHGFHDANKRLPFNGIVAAVPGDNKTGCWAFQILPFVEATTMFTGNPLNTNIGMTMYMCPGRGRPSVSTTGAWTDYFINTWINDSDHGRVNNSDNLRNMVGITDGTSNTIFVGHGNIDPTLYGSNVAMAQSTDIFKGGNGATARFTTKNQIDTANDTALNWGGPFPQGALMGMGDASVRFMPYAHYNGGVIETGVSTQPGPLPRGDGAPPPEDYNWGLGAFLTPRGNESTTIPDA